MQNKPCIVCGRPLRSAKGKAVGFGPVCAKKRGAPSLPKRFQAHGVPASDDLFTRMFIGGIDPVVDREPQDVNIMEVLPGLNGKRVKLRYRLSGGEVVRVGRLSLERDLLLLYKGRKAAGDYDFLLDLKYHASRIISVTEDSV